MPNLKQVLIKRDNMSESEAEAEISDMMSRVSDGENPEEVLEEIGLEPDYVFDIIPF